MFRLPAGAALVAIGLVSWTGSLTAQGMTLAGLLTATPWCSFSYNKVTGYSNTTRFQFFGDGNYVTGGRSEGYSSGPGGSLASQGDNRAGGRWQLQGTMLHMTRGGELQEPVSLVVRQNSNGSRTLVWDFAPDAASYVVALRAPNSPYFNQTFPVIGNNSGEWGKFTPEFYEGVAVAAVDENGLMGPVSFEYAINN